jgi:hypothetical protein
LVAAMRVDMDRKTARKYRDQAKLPSELETWPRKWRTRQDPFADVWEEVTEQSEASPSLQAKTLFEWLQRRYPSQFQDGQLRTLQRRGKELVSALLNRGKMNLHQFSSRACCLRSPGATVRRGERNA